MALIHCPECGREVSDLAAACVHCGYHLRTAGIPARYALILEDAGPNPEKTAAILHKHLTLTQEEGRRLTEETPAVVVQGLTWAEACGLSERLSHACACKMVRDKSVWTPEAVRDAAPVDLEQERSRASPEGRARPMNFWQTMGAVLAALVIWTLLLLWAGVLR